MINSRKKDLAYLAFKFYYFIKTIVQSVQILLIMSSAIKLKQEGRDEGDYRNTI